jgi:hypothetical protein
MAVLEGACAGQGPELAGERRAVLEGFKLCLTERVIVRDVRAGMALADVQVGQHGDGLRCHRRAAVSVDGVRCDAAVAGDRGADEFPGVLGGVHFPADCLAREDAGQVDALIEERGLTCAKLRPTSRSRSLDLFGFHA